MDNNTFYRRDEIKKIIEQQVLLSMMEEDTVTHNALFGLQSRLLEAFEIIE